MSSLRILKKQTFLKMLENSPGTRLFNSLFAATDDGVMRDILNDGEFSCAFFVSNVLTLFELLSRPKATVKSLREELLSKGWRQVTQEEITPGDIIFWEIKKHDDGSETEHVGFALSKDEAVSTSFKEHAVARHHITYGTDTAGAPTRPITLILCPELIETK